jgi:elongation factor P--(R)-beta-lysine ligase
MSRRFQFELLQIIRNFFSERGFVDVLTPPAVENPGMEVHIHPFALYSVKDKTKSNLYLHTSPEFCLKELISGDDGLSKVFSLSYCFRDEPKSTIHRTQFIMLEWYRTQVRYEVIMKDVEDLIQYTLQKGVERFLPIRNEFIGPVAIVRKTMQELFLEYLQVDILEYLDISAIKNLLSRFPDVPVPASDLEWDDYFFLLYLNKIEPHLHKTPLLMITEFPAPLSALSTLKQSDPRVCERFEVYVRGIELCNCFNELTDVREQKERFLDQARLKTSLYGYELPEPKRFYQTMEQGLPASAGVALGVERLLYSLFEVENPFFY